MAKRRKNDLKDMYLKDTPSREKLSAFLDKVNKYLWKIVLVLLVIIVIGRVIVLCVS